MMFNNNLEMSRKILFCDLMPDIKQVTALEELLERLFWGEGWR